MAVGQDESSLEKSFLGSVDQGTTSTRFFIFDSAGVPVASHQIEFKQMHPHSGWHEQDPSEILDSVNTCIKEATDEFVRNGHTVSDIKAIGITNQRETTVVWDCETGRPLCNAIAWPDTRTAPLVRELKKREGASRLQEKCGLPLSTYPASVKLLWLLRNVDAVRDAYNDGRLTFGTMDAWLLYNFNGGKDRNLVVTDVTNASRTMFLNLHTLDYDDELLDFFQLDRDKIILPKIVSCADPTAFGSMVSGPLKDIPITGCLGDQSSALVGQGAFDVGMAKNTYGTGCFLLCNVGDKPVLSKHGLLATVGYDLGSGHKPTYALEGSIAAAGSAIRFLQNNLGFFDHARELEALASEVEDSGGVVFVTAFSGLFAPYWIDDARGTIFGLTHHTQRSHIARACLEATCFQTKAILDAMRQDSGHEMHELHADGGMSNSDLCMQIQANTINLPVHRPEMRETTALGAAIAAGLAIGVWPNLDAVKDMMRAHLPRDVFTPVPTTTTEHDDSAQRGFARWQRAVRMASGWVVDGDDD